MNILVIKQTSLGDVLHSTPHIRAIKKKYPRAHLSVVTAVDSAQIMQQNQYVDEVILFDYARFKQLGIRSPRAVFVLFKELQKVINLREYDLAFDLQGLLRSVVLLYFAPAKHKFVKGRWPGLGGFKNKNLHAIDEMTQVLAQADIAVTDTIMEFAYSEDNARSLQIILASKGQENLIQGKQKKPFIVISPLTRWRSKNWPIARFIELAHILSETCRVLITGAPNDAPIVKAALGNNAETDKNIIDLTGALTLAELAELMSHAALVVSGDSFPMHLATAAGAPLIALFGPTDELKTGPRRDKAKVIRPNDCQRCDNPKCQRACLGQISVASVATSAKDVLQKRGESDFFNA